MVGEAKLERIDIDIDRGASPRQSQELPAFVQYCVERIERDLGTGRRWSLRITESMTAGYSCMVAVQHGCGRLEATGAGSDRVQATWDAIGRVEQLLRERRGPVISDVDPEAK